jgi:hypothetical protein
MARPPVWIAAALLAACSNGGPTPIEIPIVEIQITNNGCVGVVEGETCTIVAVAFSTGGQQIANPVLRWESNQLAVARVSERGGVVTAIAPGNATITVTNTTGAVQAQADVIVLPATGDM